MGEAMTKLRRPEGFVRGHLLKPKLEGQDILMVFVKMVTAPTLLIYRSYRKTVAT